MNLSIIVPIILVILILIVLSAIGLVAGSIAFNKLCNYISKIENELWR